MIAEFKKYKRRKEFLDFLAEYGITEQMLKDFPKALERTPEVRTEPTAEEQQAITEKYVTKKPMTMEQIVNQFAGEVEEFYPNGKPASNA